MGQGTPEEVAEDALDAGLAAMEGEGLSEELVMGHQGAASIRFRFHDSPGRSKMEASGAGYPLWRMDMKFGTGMIGAAAVSMVVASASLAQDEGDYSYVGTSLFGEYEVDHEGAGEDASGDFTAELDIAGGRMCYLLEVEGLDSVTAAHIHQGASDRNGPPVVSLELVGEDGDDVCVDVDPDLLKKIVRNPSGFYVNVHSEAFPAGAIRGQLDE